MGRILVVAACLGIGLGSQAQAFTYNIESFRKFRSGPAVNGEFTGSYHRVKGEKLANVLIIAVQSGDRFASSGQAHIDRGAKKFAGAIGDFRETGFYVEFVVEIHDTKTKKLVRTLYIDSKIYR